MKKIEVVAAIVICGEEVLCVQRPEHKYDYISKKFEFPGGKVEPGEPFGEALLRELDEELDIKPTLAEQYHTVTHQYPDFKITMVSYLCFASDKNIILREHISSKWLRRDELNSLDWAGADIPIVDKLIENGWKVQ